MERSVYGTTPIGGHDAARVADRLNPPQATRLQPVVRRVSPVGLWSVCIAFRNWSG